MSRTFFNRFFGSLAALAAIVSLTLATQPVCLTPNELKNLGRLVVALWVLLPPVFFWVDWVIFCSELTPSERETAKHTHDLSRNIWVGLVAVLAGAFHLTDKF